MYHYYYRQVEIQFLGAVCVCLFQWAPCLARNSYSAIDCIQFLLLTLLLTLGSVAQLLKAHSYLPFISELLADYHLLGHSVGNFYKSALSIFVLNKSCHLIVQVPNEMFGWSQTMLGQ